MDFDELFKDADELLGEKSSATKNKPNKIKYMVGIAFCAVVLISVISLVSDFCDFVLSHF